MTERGLLACEWEAARDRAVLLITHRLAGIEEVDEFSSSTPAASSSGALTNSYAPPAASTPER